MFFVKETETAWRVWLKTFYASPPLHCRSTSYDCTWRFSTAELRLGACHRMKRFRFHTKFAWFRRSFPHWSIGASIQWIATQLPFPREFLQIVLTKKKKGEEEDFSPSCCNLAVNKRNIKKRRKKSYRVSNVYVEVERKRLIFKWKIKYSLFNRV